MTNEEKEAYRQKLLAKGDDISQRELDQRVQLYYELHPEEWMRMGGRYAIGVTPQQIYGYNFDKDE